jgi:hypothetical protein
MTRLTPSRARRQSGSSMAGYSPTISSYSRATGKNTKQWSGTGPACSKLRQLTSADDSEICRSFGQRNVVGLPATNLEITTTGDARSGDRAIQQGENASSGEALSKEMASTSPYFWVYTRRWIPTAIGWFYEERWRVYAATKPANHSRFLD